ncbi:MAG: FecR domain-containing protein [Myxococcaceae bacterium]
MTRTWILAVAMLALPRLAQAQAATVSFIEGSAQRIPQGGGAGPGSGPGSRSADGGAPPIMLAVGQALSVGDTIQTSVGTHVKLALPDGSVLVVAPESELVLDEVRFADGKREAFSLKLLVGKVFAKVAKAVGGSDARFQVSTQRAVAGVRGTIFRVDAIPAPGERTRQARSFPQATTNDLSRTLVRVREGKVGVEAEVRKRKGKPAVRPTGPRREVAGPKEVDVEEWEKRFVELQANQQVEVGPSGLRQTRFNPTKKDAFDRFVDEHP